MLSLLSSSHLLNDFLDASFIGLLEMSSSIYSFVALEFP